MRAMVTTTLASATPHTKVTTTLTVSTMATVTWRHTSCFPRTPRTLSVQPNFSCGWSHTLGLKETKCCKFWPLFRLCYVYGYDRAYWPTQIVFYIVWRPSRLLFRLELATTMIIGVYVERERAKDESRHCKHCERDDLNLERVIWYQLILRRDIQKAVWALVTG